MTAIPARALVIVVNGLPFELRAIALTETSDHIPKWVVDVGGFSGRADSLEVALLMAAREASKAAKAKEAKT